MAKLANADVRAAKTLVGFYYRPADGAGSQITGQDIAQKFAADVECWTEQKLTMDAVAPFDRLQHDVFQRGAVLVWQLAEQPKQYF